MTRLAPPPLSRWSLAWPLSLRWLPWLSLPLLLPAQALADGPLRGESGTAPIVPAPIASAPIVTGLLDATWVLDQRIEAHGLHIERYVQRVAGLRVDQAWAIVRTRPDGVRDVFEVESPVRDAARVTVPAIRTLSDARRDQALAQTELPFVPASFEPSEAVLAGSGVDPTRVVLAHRVVVRGVALDQALSVLIDDASLQVLRVDSLVHDARGRVYLRNSASDEGVTVDVELHTPTDPAVLTNAAFSARSCDVSPAGACTPVAHAVPDVSGDFLYDPEPASFEDGFAEVMAYHHANVLADRLERDHGFRWRCTAEGAARNDSMRVFANYTDSPGRAYPNAAYLGSTRTACGYLMFGQSGEMDFASDADVVYHELGHAVTDQLAGIVGFTVDTLGLHYEPLGIAEGTSDYWAATTQGDPHVGESLEGLDGLGRSAALRDLDGALRCPHDLVGEGHFDGRIWAGAFWDLRTELGERKADALMFATIASVGSTPTLRSAAMLAASTADALVTTDTLSVEDAARVRALLGERGLLDCVRIIALDDAAVEPLGFSGIAALTRGVGNRVAPVHYRVAVPADATRVSFEITPVTVTGRHALLARRGEPVSLRGTNVRFDQRDEVTRGTPVRYDAASPAFAPCSDLYFAIETTDLGSGESLFTVRAEVTRSGDPAARCPEPSLDAGAPDAGAPDAATETLTPDAGAGGTSGGGCGCQVPSTPEAGGAVPALAGVLGLGVALARRQPKRRRTTRS